MSIMTSVSGNPLAGSTCVCGPTTGDFQLTMLSFANRLNLFVHNYI